MTNPETHQILRPEEGPVAEVVNPGGRSCVCLVCEHASAMIPASLGALGLRAADRSSHAVWDPGAADLARALSDMLDAPLVLSRVSRLVHDCNRPPERPDAMPDRTEEVEIPGNRALSPQHRAARVSEIYEPFHRAVTDTLDGMGASPVLVTIHSFTPFWHGKPRATEIGLLHDAEPRLARAMLAAAPPGPRIELNQPYSAADGVTHMLARHGTARGRDNVMIEVRNDLLADEMDVRKIADLLCPMLEAALMQVSMQVSA
ncbi:Riorf59 protein [Candidatus Rhodobacter oscarellae]|uniref:Riorf59 protein n=1 Tax=Candidatus Rhodobacter oscarellae TaxID=1675527 RepID=A0A0J9EC75_9RHOB|nr:N-formylglutamate amidohydrolase [Candidatus Rhodobacter lobularis]KMW60370.1 Riorf59 protein [Candidatus Rhodobacter lobularis]